MRTFRKDVNAEELERYKVRTLRIGNKELVVDVDDDGNYIGHDPRIAHAIKVEVMTEAREARLSLPWSPRKEARGDEVSVVEVKVEPYDY